MFVYLFDFQQAVQIKQNKKKTEVPDQKIKVYFARISYKKQAPKKLWTFYASAMVTSTSTPGSMLIDVICFTISDGECKSMIRLWIRIWNFTICCLVDSIGICQQTKVYYLETIPSLRTFTTRCLSCCDAQSFGWHTNRSLDTELLFLGTGDQIGTHFLQWTYILRCQCNTNAMYLWDILFRFLDIFTANCCCLVHKKMRLC